MLAYSSAFCYVEMRLEYVITNNMSYGNNKCELNNEVGVFKKSEWKNKRKDTE